MKKVRQVFITVLTVWLLAGTQAYAQGNFTTEWESPAEIHLLNYAVLNNLTNNYSLIFINLSQIKIFNPQTYTEVQSWNIQNLSNIYELVGIGEFERINSNKIDVNNDGYNELILTEINLQNGQTTDHIVDSQNGTIFYTGKIENITDIDNDGFLEILWSYQDPITHARRIKIISTPAQTVSVENPNEVIKDYDLKQNYPNPFNPSTVIEYSLTKSGYVKVVIFDMLGRELKTLVDTKQSAGSYKVNLQGSEFSSGTYFYSLIVDGVPETKKMILVK